MRQTLKFLLALLIAFVAMIAFRAVALTVFTIHTHAMQPVFKEGDCVLVNRWSYGLRVGGENIFPYGRICRQEIEKGDIVARYRKDIGCSWRNYLPERKNGGGAWSRQLC